MSPITYDTVNRTISNKALYLKLLMYLVPVFLPTVYTCGVCKLDIELKTVSDIYLQFIFWNYLLQMKGF
jgi:hypothetical protein